MIAGSFYTEQKNEHIFSEEANKKKRVRGSPGIIAKD